MINWLFRRKLKDINLTVSSNLWSDSLIKFKKNKLALFSAIILFSLLLIALILPSFLPYDYDEIDWDISFPSSPDIEYMHLFGTDANGRDLLVRTLYGIRISFLIGVLSSGVSLIIGVIYGSVAGYLGGKIDQVMMRFVDILYSLPFMFFVILLMVVFGRNFLLIFVSLGAVGWLTMARIVRGQTMSIKNKEFIEAAKSYGVSTYSIIFRHIIPNLLGTIIIYLTLTIPEVILIESFLSFLGLGVQEPMTSLGLLISEGAKVLDSYTWMFLAPVVFLILILFCFNFIGDGIRDALDPKQK